MSSSNEESPELVQGNAAFKISAGFEVLKLRMNE
jgi:hypothetical protein